MYLHLRKEVLAFTRACERLLSVDMVLTEDEHLLFRYYMYELSQKFPSEVLPVSERQHGPLAHLRSH